ncbi:MAG: cupin domain-containing protein [Pseudomonadota bacterium]
MSDFPVVTKAENVTRQVLSDDPLLMVVAVRFAAEGAEGPLHSHPNLQSTYVESGRFRFIVGDLEREVGPGDSFVVPSGELHGCVCLEPGVLIDCFTPRREDFL